MGEKPLTHVDPADFWDLSDLVPPKKKGAAFTVPRPDTESVEIASPRTTHIVSSGQTPVVDIPLSERPVSLKAAAPPPEPDERYRPAAPLLFEVRLYRNRRAASDERFAALAEKWQNVVGKPCADAEFYSYLPHYDQLTSAQRSAYFWWRTRFCGGETPETCYSYLLLHLFEIINLSRTLDPAEGQARMLRLWLSYRVRFPQFDTVVREWLCDYTLIHRLTPPVLPPDAAAAVLPAARLKEFYITGAGERAMTDALLRYCNNYDFRKSKFYRPDTAALFERVMPGVAETALGALGWQNGAPPRGHEISTLTRTAYSGALCGAAAQYTIEVDYVSFSHTHALRFVITDALKYAENTIRAAMGVKSRLSVFEIGAELRAALDAYLAATVPPKRSLQKHAPSAPAPAYERRYDLPVGELSPRHAAEIEQTSWDTTKRLIEAFEEEKDPQTERETPVFAPVCPPPPKASPSVAETAENADVFAPYRDFLRACDKKDRAAQRAAALASDTLPAALADAVNEAALAAFGDIIVEETDGGYAIVAEYRAALAEKGVITDE